MNQPTGKAINEVVNIEAAFSANVYLKCDVEKFADAARGLLIFRDLFAEIMKNKQGG